MSNTHRTHDRKFELALGDSKKGYWLTVFDSQGKVIRCLFGNLIKTRTTKSCKHFLFSQYGGEEIWDLGICKLSQQLVVKRNYAVDQVFV